MALIKCLECNKEFSETANVCPHCGYKKKREEVKQKTVTWIKKVRVIVLIFVLAILIQIFLQEILGVKYPPRTTLFFLIGITTLLIWGAKSLGYLAKE